MQVKKKPLPSKELLNELFDYDCETGILTWRKGVRGMFYEGKEAGTTTENGYRQVCINNVTYLSHRVIWSWMTGEDPNYIDHIDGNRLNNCFCNLRSVEVVENSKNSKRSSSNSSGVTGVAFFKRVNKWIAYIIVSGRQIHLGYFNTFEAAVIARRAAEIKYKFHKNHGRVGPGQAVPTI